jgi:hypothetical protein
VDDALAKPVFETIEIVVTDDAEAGGRGRVRDATMTIPKRTRLFLPRPTPSPSGKDGNP